jgi:hypothetical protein
MLNFHVCDSFGSCHVKAENEGREQKIAIELRCSITYSLIDKPLKNAQLPLYNDERQTGTLFAQ